MEIETSKKEASTELAKRKELESITIEASNRVSSYMITLNLSCHIISIYQHIVPRG